MKDLAFLIVKGGQTFNHVPLAILAGIATRCQHYTERGTFVPVDFGAVQVACKGRLTEFHQIGTQSQHDRLGLGVTETYIEFQYPRGAVGPDHEPGVEKPGKFIALLRHSGHGRSDHLVHDATVNLRCHHRCR